MNAQAENVEKEVSESNRAPGIARGRMAAALVYLIKFQEEGSDSEIAAKYCTTPGKVNDIRKNRNFKYITKDLRFTEAEVQEARDRFKASVYGENSTVPENKREEVVLAINEALDTLETVAESQLADLRKADRKPRGKPRKNESEDDANTGDAETDESSEEEDLEDLLED